VLALIKDLTSITAAESSLVHANRLQRQGLTPAQIADLLSRDEAIKQELWPMYENLDRLSWNSLRTAYEKAYQSCLCSAQDYLAPMMAALFREMTLFSETEALKIGSVEKNVRVQSEIELQGRRDGVGHLHTPLVISTRDLRSAETLSITGTKVLLTRPHCN
jgi:hypothetical protein